MNALADLRCDGRRTSGPQKGMPCRYLLCKVHPSIIGQMETKCPRCNTVRLWVFTGDHVGRRLVEVSS